MRSSYGPKWSPLQAFFFQINLLSNLNILKLALGDWSCSGNIKQDFLMISPICCFTKKAVNKRTYISETSPNHPDYPWFSKCTLNLGLEKHMLINSADMSHLPLFSHWSVNVGVFFSSNLSNLFYKEKHTFLALFIKLSVPISFFPDCVKHQIVQLLRYFVVCGGCGYCKWLWVVMGGQVGVCKGL